MTRQIHMRRFVLPAAVAVGGAFAARTAFRLADYHVPLTLVISCGSAAFTVVLMLALRLAEAGATRTHRCKKPGCDFSVRLTHADPGENRKWQEITARHPHRL